MLVRLPVPQPQPILLVVASLLARRNAAGKLVLSRKFLTGLEAYAASWPGRVAGCVKLADEPDDSLDLAEYDPAATTVEIREAPWDVARMESVLPGTSVALLNDDVYGRSVAKMCLRMGIPYVHMLEWDPLTRRQIIWRGAPDVLRAAKRVLWSELGSLARRRSMTDAAGLQCNGNPTYAVFSRHNARTLLYFDSRVTREMVIDEATLATRTAELEAGRPLRLVFSGRLVAIKGVDHLPRVAAALVARGVPFTMDICGSGALENALRGQVAAHGLQDRVRLRGTLDFEKQLLPFVSRQTDLFVCCHLQGDPSCTYLETFSCGVPMVGYANPSLRGFVERADLGWTVPDFEPEPLAELIQQLERDPRRITRAAHAAREFALRHTFENTMRMRTEHLLACSGVAAPQAARSVRSSS